MKKEDIEFFDSKSEFSVVERKLPHWIQSGSLCFVTWRAADSLPKAVLLRIDSEIRELLGQFELDFDKDWKSELKQRPPAVRAKLARNLMLARDKFLDEGHGLCQLSKSECSRAVMQSLLHFDEDRYFMTDIVIMPNHVHFMAAFRNEESFLKQCTDWKRFTARKINRLCDCKGEFWQVDQFDHLIRSGDAFEYFRKYIANNPIKVNLGKDQFLHFSKEV